MNETYIIKAKVVDKESGNANAIVETKGDLESILIAYSCIIKQLNKEVFKDDIESHKRLFSAMIGEDK